MWTRRIMGHSEDWDSWSEQKKKRQKVLSFRYKKQHVRRAFYAEMDFGIALPSIYRENSAKSTAN